MKIKTSKLEGVLTLYDEDGQLIGIVLGNGSVKFYKVKPANFGDITELLGADVVEKK